MGEEPLKYFKALKKYHVIGALETHLRGAAALEALKQLKFAGWRASCAQATISAKSENGTSGGAILCHKPFLTSACPAVAEGKDGSQMPEGKLVWKHFRMEGMHIVICFAYFTHSIGLQGPNL